MRSIPTAVATAALAALTWLPRDASADWSICGQRGVNEEFCKKLCPNHTFDSGRGEKRTFRTLVCEPFAWTADVWIDVPRVHPPEPHVCFHRNRFLELKAWNGDSTKSYIAPRHGSGQWLDPWWFGTVKTSPMPGAWNLANPNWPPNDPHPYTSPELGMSVVEITEEIAIPNCDGCPPGKQCCVPRDSPTDPCSWCIPDGASCQ